MATRGPDERGTSNVEYAVLVALVVLVCMSAWRFMYEQVGRSLARSAEQVVNLDSQP